MKESFYTLISLIVGMQITCLIGMSLGMFDSPKNVPSYQEQPRTQKTDVSEVSLQNYPQLVLKCSKKSLKYCEEYSAYKTDIRN